ncbi:MAG: hypothetical protein U9O87_10020 [Verrucomicrobiota bacterium]|nr:hypothetical protein [Verrucomicrobiota bacterium]
MKKLFKYVFFLMILSISVPILNQIQSKLNTIKREHRLTETEPLENAPPIVAFTTIALGGFRGLVADVLFLRSQKLQESESYFEIVQLASWITKLQPRFTGATAFLAWNMAYNISVTFSSHEDRWRWVQRGIELIRDEALEYNPGDPILYKELGWIYQHKIGQLMDDANRYYKVQMATEIMKILDGEGGTETDWQKYANTPKRAEEFLDFLAAYPDFLKKSKLTSKLLDEYEIEFRDANQLPEKLKNAAKKDLLENTFEIYFRAKWLREVAKLDSGFIYGLNQKYGALDWRLPEAHAIYWASKGVEATEDKKNIECERMIFQSLKNAFQQGRLIYAKDVGLLQMSPNISIVDAVNMAYLSAEKQHPDNSSISGGYGNFLIDAVVTLYTFGEESKAKEYFQKYRKEFPGKTKERNFHKFALKELAGDVSSASYKQAEGIIFGMYFQMCRLLTLGEVKRAEAIDRIAKKVYITYQFDIGDTQVRRGLPPLKQIKAKSIGLCIKSFPKSLVETLRKKLENE